MRPSVSHYTQYKETVLFRATSTEIEASRSDRTDHRTERTDRRRRETTSECAPHDVNVTERMIEYAQRVCIASKSTSTDPYKKTVIAHTSTPGENGWNPPETKESRSRATQTCAQSMSAGEREHSPLSTASTALKGQRRKRNRKKNKPDVFDTDGAERNDSTSRAKSVVAYRNAKAILPAAVDFGS